MIKNIDFKEIIKNMDKKTWEKVLENRYPDKEKFLNIVLDMIKEEDGIDSFYKICVMNEME